MEILIKNLYEKMRKIAYAAMDFDKGQRSIDAWYFMFSICFFKASLSMVANVLASIRVRLFEFLLTQASICNSPTPPIDGDQLNE